MASKVIIESLPTSLSAMSTMPFLYQTRTLASICWMRSVAQPRYLQGAGGRAFGSSRRSADKEPLGTTRKWNSYSDKQSSQLSDFKETDTEESGPVIRRVTRLTEQHGAANPLPEGWESETGYDDSHKKGSLVRRSWKNPLVEEPVDLIPTVAGRRDQPRAERSHLPWKGSSQTTTFDEFGAADGRDFAKDPSMDIEFDEEDSFYEERDAIDSLTSRADPDELRTSTITPSEKHAFQKIFSDIFARHQGSGQNEAPSLDLFKEESEADSSVESGKKRLGKIISDANVTLTREQMEATVNRYPLALRAAAARAIGFRLDDPDSQSEEQRIGEKAMDRKLEKLRKPERERVEGLMRAAMTDFELWSVMEKEVFPLIEKLGLGDIRDDEAGKPTKAPSKAKRKRKSKIAVVDTDENETEVSEAEVKAPEAELPEALKTKDGISALALYGPLYPSHLLLGLRLLDRSFAKPSLLTLSVLPKIKSLGLLSHVLGGSTSLYNELIFIHWHQRDDFLGVLSLLSEMEQSGLDWDDQTLNIITKIDATQKATMRGERGDELNALWNLPEFAPRKFTSWKEKIRQSLAEREQVAY